ncbi:NAD(P)H-dependent flavin oxidoreductase [Zestomonas carbonaria]|uniref:Nitronate monooxygenase n=1 Tax=Zestomonas carbonaria TaxID=2762745 RepID=A0A7U7IAJ7_9GAMM|nr:nitronate monooxygenase [Pseudomonas carbonaria]CAD5108921.1 Nitronate monooxygenase [Pseudomonas carbonaria]
MSHQVCRLLGIQHPIIQAPMAGVSTPQLAAAVSNAGGLGSLGIGASSVEQVRGLIAETRSLTSRPFNLNLFCHRPAQSDAVREAAWLEHLRPFFAEFGANPPAALREPYPSFVADPAMLELLLAERPAVVSFHFGLPDAETLRALKAAGIVLLASATNLDEARQVEEAGIDGLIAQGVEAGGHRGLFDPAQGDAGIGTLALVRLFVRHTRLPVIAAGGIMDGAGIAAALVLGAGAAQLGTAFILCPESSANAAYREALQSPRAQHTGITAAISGRPARGLVNRMHREVDVPGAPLPDYPIAYDAGKALHAAASAKGCHDFAAHWAGQGASLARALPAAELVKVLVEEWQQ